MQITTLRKHPYYRAILVILLIVAVVVLWQLSGRILSTTKAVTTEDHWRFWTAWRLTSIGENPYDSRNLSLITDEIPWLSEQPDYVPLILNPPWVITFGGFYSIFSYPISRMIWLITSIIFLMASANVTWKIYHGLTGLRWVGWLVTFTFFPTLAMLKQGQINPWILLGLVGFLYWTTQKRNDWLAGISLALTTVKPQLLLILWLPVLLWMLRERRWKILLGMAAVLSVSSLVVTIANPMIFRQFLDTFLVDTPVEWLTPTIGYYLRRLLGWEKFWLQFVASFLGIVWVIAYWIRNRANWDWLKELPLLLWVCILTSPYSWTYDQVVLLIPILAVFTRLLAVGWTRRNLFFLASFLLINGVVFLLHRGFTDEFFIWLAPLYLIWCWLADRFTLAEQALIPAA